MRLRAARTPALLPRACARRCRSRRCRCWGRRSRIRGALGRRARARLPRRGGRHLARRTGAGGSTPLPLPPAASTRSAKPLLRFLRRKAAAPGPPVAWLGQRARGDARCRDVAAGPRRRRRQTLRRCSRVGPGWTAGCRSTPASRHAGTSCWVRTRPRAAGAKTARWGCSSAAAHRTRQGRTPPLPLRGAEALRTLRARRTTPNLKRGSARVGSLSKRAHHVGSAVTLPGPCRTHATRDACKGDSSRTAALPEQKLAAAREPSHLRPRAASRRARPTPDIQQQRKGLRAQKRA